MCHEKIKNFLVLFQVFIGKKALFSGKGGEEVGIHFLSKRRQKGRNVSFLSEGGSEWRWGDISYEKVYFYVIILQ
ncbi:MAG: hypothetical protein BM485_00185 [Desulfobulbaceae bacterium DB1]|nr:MAG: hypothetical protein BM485_00185 [Desulfobulbaceae bacterium DB1]